MGRTLHSLDHYAVENQNNGNGLLGNHKDMNHDLLMGWVLLMIMVMLIGTLMDIMAS